MDNEEISQFVNYSKIFSSVIELESTDNKDISDNVYARVVNIMKKATFIISQDTENLIYEDIKKLKKNKDKDDEDKENKDKEYEDKKMRIRKIRVKNMRIKKMRIRKFRKKRKNLYK